VVVGRRHVRVGDPLFWGGGGLVSRANKSNNASVCFLPPPAAAAADQRDETPQEPPSPPMQPRLLPFPPRRPLFSPLNSPNQLAKMSEHEAETFETADAGASLTYPQQASRLLPLLSPSAPSSLFLRLSRRHAPLRAARRLRPDAALTMHWPCPRARIGAARAAILWAGGQERRESGRG
jgi:hypothetical protein